MAKVAIIGAGNLGYHLLRMMVENGQQVVQMISSNYERVKKMAEPLNIPYSDNFNEIKDADVYFLCIADRYIKEYSERLKITEGKLVVHTSGISSKDIISSQYKKGVFYPLQTFTEGRGLKYERIPIFYEAENSEHEILLKQIASKISDLVYYIPYEKRQKMHLAAVFANNFTNHMLYQAEKLCNKMNLDFDLLKPLIEETTAKIHAKSSFSWSCLSI